MSTARAGTTRYNSIQALRGIAALLVVFHHSCMCFFNCGIQTSFLAQNAFIRETGACGVDIFFVISGFIMVVINASKPIEQRTTSSFLLHRLVRIVPLYWFYTTVLLLMLPLPFVFPETKSALTWDYILKSYLFIPAPNAHGALHPLVEQGWTLVYEMMFYAVFSLFVRVPAGKSIICITALFVSLMIGRVLLRVEDPIYRYFTYGIILEFSFGMMTGWLLLRRPQIPRAALWFLWGASIFGFFVPAVFPAEGLHRAVMWGIPAWGLVLFSSLLEANGAKRNWGAWLVYLGDCSYSIYLTHGFVMLALESWLKSISLPTGVADVGVLIVWVGAVIPGIFSYHFIEKPLTAWFQRSLKPQPTRSRCVVSLVSDT